MLHQSEIGQRLICEWMTSRVLMFKVICKVKMTEKYPKTTIFQQNLQMLVVRTDTHVTSIRYKINISM